MRPSLYNLLIFRRELAKAISLLSFGSNHIFRRPHFNTDEANRFCNFKETEIMSRKNWSKNEKNKGSEHCSVQIYSLQRCMNENDREISVIWKQRHEKNAFPPEGTKGVRCLRWSLHSIHTTTSATLQQLFDTTKKYTHQSVAVITYYPYCWWFNLIFLYMSLSKRWIVTTLWINNNNNNNRACSFGCGCLRWRWTDHVVNG